MDIKIITFIIAITLLLISYFFYYRDIFKGKTKPHTYTWLVWSTLTGIGFFGQLSGGGGLGSVLLGVASILSAGIFFLSLSRGEKDITLSDKVSLISAGVGLWLWYLTKNPLSTIILITFTDMLGYYPTIRKSIKKPQEETLETYFFGSIIYLISFFSLENFNIITLFYPAGITFMNWVMVVLLIVRRKQLQILQSLR